MTTGGSSATSRDTAAKVRATLLAAFAWCGRHGFAANLAAAVVTGDLQWGRHRSGPREPADPGPRTEIAGRAYQPGGGRQ